VGRGGEGEFMRRRRARGEVVSHRESYLTGFFWMSDVNPDFLENECYRRGSNGMTKQR
jgi:hypothetical protein